MKKIIEEFKAFAFKGNMIELAVAVIIGGAFGALVNSLVKNIVMPALSYFLPASGDYRTWHLGKIEVGAFLGESVNFLIISGVVFVLVVKVIGTLANRRKSAAVPTTKECPECLSVIPLKAKRCAHCTSVQSLKNEATP